MLERHLEQASMDKPELNQCRLYTLYTVLFFMNLFANCDHGILPAGSVGIKGDLSLNNAQYGLLGSIVFAGLTFGKLQSFYNIHVTRCLT
jgi:hypothetical protein